MAASPPTPDPREPPAPPDRGGPLAVALDGLEGAGRFGLFLAAGLRASGARGALGRRLLREMLFVGTRSLLVIAASGWFIGMVVALQFHDTLVRFGSVALLGSAVGLSLVRELGPVVTALMVTARAGSAMAAELGIMRVDLQVDALECMAIDPYRFLVAPKLVACVLAMPLLVALFVVVGIGGGYLVGVLLLGVGSGAYFEGMYQSVLGRDLVMGLAKALVFGLLIGWFSTAKGFLIHLGPHGDKGAEGVSRATTEAVVTTALGILLADYVVSALLV